MGDSRTRPILSMLLTHSPSGQPVVQVVSLPSARSYSAYVSRWWRILPKVRSGAAHCVKLLKILAVLLNTFFESREKCTHFI